MLANLLPGIRHVRTPLITGYLYFVALYLAVGGQRLTPESDGTILEQRLSELLDEVGRTAAFAALSVAALLVGSLLTISRWAEWPARRAPFENLPPSSRKWVPWVWMADWCSPLVTWAERLAGRPTEMAAAPKWCDLLAADALPEEFRRNLVESSRDFNRLGYTYVGLLSDYGPRAVHSDALEEDRGPRRRAARYLLESTIEAQRLAECVLAAVVGEVEQLASQAQIKRPVMYNEYDRYMAEAELRFSILFPLCSICVIAASTWHVVAVVFLLIPFALFANGIKSQNRADAVVLRGVGYGTLESPTAKAYVAWMQTLSASRCTDEP